MDLVLVIKKIKKTVNTLFHLLLTRIAPVFVNLYVRLLFLLSDIELHISKKSDAILKSDNAVVLMFWHSRLLLMPYIVRRIYNRRGCAIVSRHRDGEYISKFLATYGHFSTRGSSNNGGFSALKSAISILKDGYLLAITPDGPIGPRYEVNSNIAVIAKMYDVPILCACYSARRAKKFNTWDRFLLPYLLRQRIIIEIFDPIYPAEIVNWEDANAGKEVNKLLSDILNEQMYRLDKEVHKL